MGNLCSGLGPSTSGQHYLQDLLKDAAEKYQQRHLILYSRGDRSSPRRISYSTLYTEAKEKSFVLRSLDGFEQGQPILIHLEDHWDTILWFWSVLLAGSLPVISSPFSNLDEHRHKHVQGLSTLLQSPICLTRRDLVEQFDCSHSLQLHTIESLAEPSLSGFEDEKPFQVAVTVRRHEAPEGTALLMLTSGSTGNAKAVQLSHRQVLAAVAGKASARRLTPNCPLLNWIGLDHVASLVEIHIQALWLGVDQVHVYASDIVSSPTLFLDLLSKHQVCRSFAPNFFLAKLVSTLEAMDDATNSWDLSALTILASGGEPNEIRTCTAVTDLLAKYGARRDIITPGFGMTETCAGAIYNMNCPGYDVKHDRSLASLGKCMRGIEMRITTNETGVKAKLAATNQAGYLEVRGPIVFNGYYRNPQATAEAISRDGWFRTGDQAAIDFNGNLNLVGRFKEVFNINGIKRDIADVQVALEEALASRVSRIVCFPSRAANTEQVTIAFIPLDSSISPKEMIDICDEATRVSVFTTSSLPLVFSLSESSLPLLPVSSLGKISRSKMQSLFESGVFNKDVDLFDQTVEDFRQVQKDSSEPPTDAEAALIKDIIQTLDVDPIDIGLDSPIYSLGITSMDLIRLKNRIDTRLNISIPVIVIMKHATVRSLSVAIDTYTSPHTDESTVIPYDPIVPFQTQGEKTPLWLIHPGVGEVLVFVGLTQHMAEDDRPIYALRARGFENGHEPFSNIPEVVNTYFAAIRKQQPKGPYALAGYSYGTMIAFEISKRLEAAGEEVGFLGSFNLPPHIKQRMRQLSWNMCLLHLAQFLALVTEKFAEAMEDDREYRHLPRSKALGFVLAASDASRLQELALSEQAMCRWADVAFNLQGMAVDYDPSGSIGVIDIFHAIPLKMAAGSSQEWVNEHLSKWKDFCRTTPKFHHVGGAHYTMLGPEYVESFALELMKTLRGRGL